MSDNDGREIVRALNAIVFQLTKISEQLKEANSKK